MSIDELRQIAAREAGRPVKGEWVLEPFQPKWEGVVVAFDQSLAKTGCTTIHVYDGEWSISTRMFKTESDWSGHEGNLQRAEEQYKAYLAYLESRHPDLVVHETPPVASRMSRPESSLLAAREVRRACIALDLPYVMIGAQTAKTRFTGKANSKKKELAAAARLVLPQLNHLKPNNEDTCDAAALAVVAFEMEEPHGI